MKYIIHDIDTDALIKAYLEACEVELQAYKPGNVSIHAAGHDMTVEDFRTSSHVSAPALCNPAQTLGNRILGAVTATRSAVGCNTNLGIILLAAPLLAATNHGGNGSGSLRASLQETIDNSTIHDAELAYQAICLAQPGGLGNTDAHDVRDPPKITLKQAMEAASNRDRIAYQYAYAYSTVFDFAIPRYHLAMSRWNDERWAAVYVFASLLGEYPDSHIERKFDQKHSFWVAGRMREIERSLLKSRCPEEVLPLLRETDTAFKALGINPGTTADLTVASMLAVRLEQLAWTPA